MSAHQEVLHSQQTISHQSFCLSKYASWYVFYTGWLNWKMHLEQGTWATYRLHISVVQTFIHFGVQQSAQNCHEQSWLSSTFHVIPLFTKFIQMNLMTLHNIESLRICGPIIWTKNCYFPVAFKVMSKRERLLRIRWFLVFCLTPDSHVESSSAKGLHAQSWKGTPASFWSRKSLLESGSARLVQKMAGFRLNK